MAVDRFHCSKPADVQVSKLRPRFVLSHTCTRNTASQRPESSEAMQEETNTIRMASYVTKNPGTQHTSMYTHILCLESNVCFDRDVTILLNIALG